MKKIIALAFLLATFTLCQAQNKKKPQGVPRMASVLNSDQQVKVRKVNKQFTVDMKALLQTPVQNPTERQEKIEKLRANRDSTLKALLGEQTFTEYRKKTLVKKN